MPKFKMPSAQACAAFDQFRRDRGEFVRTPEAELCRAIVHGLERAFDQMRFDFLIQQAHADEAEREWREERSMRNAGG